MMTARHRVYATQRMPTTRNTTPRPRHLPQLYMPPSSLRIYYDLPFPWPRRLFTGLSGSAHIALSRTLHFLCHGVVSQKHLQAFSRWLSCLGQTLLGGEPEFFLWAAF